MMTWLARRRAARLHSDLPRGREDQRAFFRKLQADLPYFDRYLAGNCEAVWAELLALGADWRSESTIVDAYAVAYETMHRVSENVQILAARLAEEDYRFHYLDNLKPHAAHTPPGADARERIAALEDMCGGPVPLSLRAFHDVVGDVNFVGAHPSLAPDRSNFYPDPLWIDGVDKVIGWLVACGGEDDGFAALAPDALHKADVSGGMPYSMKLPNAAVDAPMEFTPVGGSFVGYLRNAIAWGGFPGWAEAAAPLPVELHRLREGLIAF